MYFSLHIVNNIVYVVCVAEELVKLLALYKALQSTYKPAIAYYVYTIILKLL